MRKAVIIIALALTAFVLAGATSHTQQAKAVCQSPSCGGSYDYDSGGAPTNDGGLHSLANDSSCAFPYHKYSTTWHLHRGSWPVNQDVYIDATWCGQVGGRVFWISRNLRASHGPLCSSSLNPLSANTWTATTVTFQGSADFSCDQGYVNLRNMERIEYYSNGYSAQRAYTHARI